MVFGRWYVVNAENPHLAWSGSRWVNHSAGLPAEGIQICNFDNWEEARDCARECGFEIVSPAPSVLSVANPNPGGDA